MLCLPSFISRKQAPDYGTDYDIELCINSAATNIKFSAQLKSVEQLVVDATASKISLEIECSRLHYLSRTPCGSLITVYDKSSQSLFYEWVHILIQVLDTKGVEWRQKNTVTVRIPLVNVLTGPTAAEIHTTVTALFQRIQAKPAIEPAPKDAAKAPDAPITADATKSPDTILALLEKSGVDYVSAGLHREVIAAYASVPAMRWSSNAKHLLTIAYAYEHSGLPLQALMHSKAALACGQKGGLSNAELAFTEHIVLTSRRNIGQVDLANYTLELAAVAAKYPNTEEARHIRLEIIFGEIVHVREQRGDRLIHVDRLVEEARKLVPGEASAEALSNWGDHFLLARIEFQASDQHLMLSAMRVRMSMKTKFPMPTEDRKRLAQATLALKTSGLTRMETLANRANSPKVKRPDLFATCCLEVALNHFSFMMITHLLNQGEGAESSSFGDSAGMKDCLARADQAGSIFERLGMTGQKLKTMRLMADILHHMGQKDKAAELLAKAKTEALAIGLDADSFKITDLPTAPTQEENDAYIANASDEELGQFAENLLQSLLLPRDRFANIFTDLQACRLIAREQKSWCKHLELIQDLAHTKRRDTHYAVDPDRHGTCARFGYESKIGVPNAKSVIDSFKSTYCEGCTGREI